MFPLAVFLSVLLAIIGIPMIRVARKGIGETTVGLSLLVGMAGVHSFHWKDKEDAGGKLAATFVVLEQRLESGEIHKVRDILKRGIRMFASGTSPLSETAEDFWTHAIEHERFTPRSATPPVDGGNGLNPPPPER